MIRFIKRNKIISFFGFIASIISLSYAITYNMPDYFGIEGWYSFFNNVSISYIAALIFYVLQVYIPECHKSQRAQKVLEPLFADLIKFMEVTIACCRRFVSVDEKDKLTIDWGDKDKKILYFVVQSNDKVHSGKGSVNRKTVAEIIQLDSVYKEKVNKIKDSIDFRECNSEILNCFSKLETEEFYMFTIRPALMFDNSFIAFPGFHESVDQFEKIKDEFKKCCGIICNYEIRDAENKEIALCEAVFVPNALQASSPAQFNETVQREEIKKQLKSFISEEKQLEQAIDKIMLLKPKIGQEGK